MVRRRANRSRVYESWLVRASSWTCLLLVASTSRLALANPESSLGLRRATTRSWSDHRSSPGLSFEIGRELHWARMTLVEDLPFLANGQTLAPVLPLAPGALDPHMLASPRALGGMASAVGQLVTRFSSFELWRQGRVQQRHHFRPFVGVTGVRLTWRIDF